MKYGEGAKNIERNREREDICVFLTSLLFVLRRKNDVSHKATAIYNWSKKKREALASFLLTISHLYTYSGSYITFVYLL